MKINYKKYNLHSDNKKSWVRCHLVLVDLCLILDFHGKYPSRSSLPCKMRNQFYCSMIIPVNMFLEILTELFLFFYFCISIKFCFFHYFSPPLTAPFLFPHVEIFDSALSSLFSYRSFIMGLYVRKFIYVWDYLNYSLVSLRNNFSSSEINISYLFPLKLKEVQKGQ